MVLRTDRFAAIEVLVPRGNTVQAARPGGINEASPSALMLRMSWSQTSNRKM